LGKRIVFIFVSGLVLSSVLLTTLPVSCIASGFGYPGGDDGGGFGWMFYVGCSSLLAMIVGVCTLVLGVIRSRRSKPRKSDELAP